MEYDIFDLEAAVKVMAGKFPSIESIYLFGSRRFETRSPRSDIDIIVTSSESIRPKDLREFTLNFNTALDLFILEDGKATSVANESYIKEETNEKLIKKVNAVLLYDNDSGESEKLKNIKKIELDKKVNHRLTALPNGAAECFEISALNKMFKRTRENGLSTKPYLGINTDEASKFVITILRRLVEPAHSVFSRGNASKGWTKKLESEYDFQNLFWIVVKPWLPNLSREDTVLKYDNQEKKSDFNLFNNQLVMELKHIKDDNSKRAIVKTLEGLKTFYTQHPNVRVLIFGILVEEKVKLDDTKWEADYSYEDETPIVRTVVIRNKK